MSECNAVKYLQQKSTEHGKIAELASVALVVVGNINKSGMTAEDIEYLHDIVSHIYLEGGVEILNFIHSEAPDCDICAALVAQIDSLVS